jgi:hypothetical protein
MHGSVIRGERATAVAGEHNPEQDADSQERLAFFNPPDFGQILGVKFMNKLSLLFAVLVCICGGTSWGGEALPDAVFSPVESKADVSVTSASVTVEAKTSILARFRAFFSCHCDCNCCSTPKVVRSKEIKPPKVEYTTVKIPHEREVVEYEKVKVPRTRLVEVVEYETQLVPHTKKVIEYEKVKAIKPPKCVNICVSPEKAKELRDAGEVK